MEIHTEQEHASALERLEYMMDHEPENLAEIVALGDAVHFYENNNGHAPVHPDSLVARIEQEMYRRRLNKGQLATLLGIPGSRLSEILHGKRSVNLDFVKRLHSKLHMPAETLLQLA